jgi:predicted nuclease with TOPRIM domain
MLEQKLLQEVNRFREINRNATKHYIIKEQAEPAALPPAGAPAAPDASAAPEMPAPDAGIPAAPGLPDSPAMGETEEVDVTDLVNMTKNIKNELETSKMENDSVIQKMDTVFSKLDDLESKLSNMDAIISKIDQLGARVEEMKPQTPQEKLEMRSLDSYPFNEKPQEFFAHKQDEMRASGKNEYVLTKNEIENYSKEELAGSFNPYQDEQQPKF